MNRLYKLLLVVMVVVLLISCGSTVVDLSEIYTGEYFSFNYPSGWELIDEEAKIKVVSGGTLLQFSVTIDESVILNDLDSISTSLIEMTTNELREMIEAIIEKKLVELLGDPDERLPIRKAFRERLLSQIQAVANGERGEPFEDVVRRLGLE